MTPRPDPGNPVLQQALEYAARGWPVFPCLPGRKTPATARGHLDATTDPGRIRGWLAGRPGLNLAVATGHPGPDVLDIDSRPDGTGFPALGRLARAGLTRDAAAWVRTPGGGLHAYYTGTTQRSTRLPASHLDFKAAGGYVLVPPSQVAGRPYHVIRLTGQTGQLDWQQAAALLQPGSQHHQPRPPDRVPDADIIRLAGWVARLEEGNRNAGLFWAACRATETGRADLSDLAAAARHAGLSDREITATLASARRTTRPHLRLASPGRQAEGEQA